MTNKRIRLTVDDWQVEKPHGPVDGTVQTPCYHFRDAPPERYYNILQLLRHMDLHVATSYRKTSKTGNVSCAETHFSWNALAVGQLFFG